MYNNQNNSDALTLLRCVLFFEIYLQLKLK